MLQAFGTGILSGTSFGPHTDTARSPGGLSLAGVLGHDVTRDGGNERR